MITQFAFLLSHGMSLMWCLMPRRHVTCGFFRIQSLVALGLSVLAALAAGRLEPISTGLAAAHVGPTAPSIVNASPDGVASAAGMVRVAAISAAVVAYLSSVCWRLEIRSVGTWCLFGVMGLTGLGLSGLVPEVWSGDFSRGGLRLLSLWSSAAVLGGATTGMLLGHWYLTAPTMSIEPLKKLTWVFLGTLAVRAAVSLWGYLQGAEALQGSLIWTWFALRWVAGIMLPIILGLMTDRILTYRNTQAATGVLFAGVILVYLGEMSAALLFAELRRAF